MGIVTFTIFPFTEMILVGRFTPTLTSKRWMTFGRSVSKDGIVHALESYLENSSSGRNLFDKSTFKILKQYGFVTADGKFSGAVKGYPVEKYLLAINETKRHNALEYLNKEFAAEAAAACC
jgi:hypothetical protein